MPAGLPAYLAAWLLAWLPGPAALFAYKQIHCDAQSSFYVGALPLSLPPPLDYLAVHVRD